nr:phosphate ABC transporter substrate-binding protein PstS [Parvibium lacunae]
MYHFFHQSKFSALLGLAFLLVGVVPRVSAQSIAGAGSTAAAPIYKVWGEHYQQALGKTLQYDAVGSGEGTKRIKARSVDFGATDIAMSPAEAQQHGLIVVPTVVTGVAPIINLANLAPGQLRLTGDLLAKIFLGEITQWQDPAIKRLNPIVKLPAQPIKVVVRADGSGTTYHFTDYLGKVNETWKTTKGVKNKYDWPPEFIAVKGSSEVAKTVASTPGSIGYVDFNYVQENKLNYAQLQNLNGKFVEPSLENFREAVANSEWISRGNFVASLTNLKGLKSWPITMGTFIALPRQDQTGKALEVLRFITWGYLHGDTLAKQAKFVALPDLVQARAYAELAKLVDRQGQLIGLQVIANPETRGLKLSQVGGIPTSRSN